MRALHNGTREVRPIILYKEEGIEKLKQSLKEAFKENREVKRILCAGVVTASGEMVNVDIITDEHVLFIRYQHALIVAFGDDIIPSLPDAKEQLRNQILLTEYFL